MKIHLNLISRKFFSPDFGKEVLDLLVEASYLWVVFLVPIWFAYLFPTYNIFEFNKVSVFKILTWLLFLFTVLKLIFFHARLNFPLRVFFKKYWLWPLLFIVGLSSTLFFSDNPLLSFYGSIERQGGLISYLFYFFWFLLLTFNILTIDNHTPSESDSKIKKIRRIIKTAVISGSLVSIYGILQILNIDFIFWPENAFTTHRTFSTLGQPNFLASWLLLVIPLSIYLWSSTRRYLSKFFYLLAVVLQIICLLLTGSRGGLVAFFFAAVLCLVYFFIVSSWSRRQKLMVATGFFCAIITFSAAVNILLPGRITSIFDFKTGSVGARTIFYSAAADSIGKRPLFGYGLEGGNEIFIKYYEPDWGVYGDVGQLTDKAHNLILDIICNIGFYGLLLFILIYYYFFSLAANNIKKGKEISLSLALSLGAAAYLFSLLFSFSIPTGEIYFWLFLSLLVVINHEKDETVGRSHYFAFIRRLFRIGRERGFSGRVKSFIKVISALVLVFLVFWQISMVFRSLMADYYFNKIFYTLAKPDYFTALTLDGYLKEQKTNPINAASYDNFWGDKLSVFYPSIDELVFKKVVREKLEEIAGTLPDKGYMNLLVKAKVNSALGRHEEAQAYLDRLIEIAPHWPLAYIEQGRLSVNRGDFKKALIACNMVLLNLPSVDDSRLNEPHREVVNRFSYFAYHSIADIYDKENNYAGAEKYYLLAYKSDPSDFTLLKLIADMAYRRGDMGQAIEYTKRGLARNPKDYKWSLALASLYHESGDKDNARGYLEKALELAPDNQEIKDLMYVYEK